MAKPSQAKAAIPYIERVLEDEFVQEQLRSAVGGLRGAYSRARAQRTQVVEDKGLYSNLRQAATAVQRATAALVRPPEPEPKHRGRKFVTVALAIGATALVTVRLQKEYARQRGGSAAAGVSADGSAAAAAASADAATASPTAPGATSPVSPAPEPASAVDRG